MGSDSGLGVVMEEEQAAAGARRRRWGLVRAWGRGTRYPVGRPAWRRERRLWRAWRLRKDRRRRGWRGRRGRRRWRDWPLAGVGVRIVLGAEWIRARHVTDCGTIAAIPSSMPTFVRANRYSAPFTHRVGSHRSFIRGMVYLLK